MGKGRRYCFDPCKGRLNRGNPRIGHSAPFAALSRLHCEACRVVKAPYWVRLAMLCRPHLLLNSLPGRLEDFGFKDQELGAGKLVCKLCGE